MDFKDQIRQIGSRVGKIIDLLQTEEATKNGLIMPFINALGYDVFNPLEVIPEFVADIGTKKGEKVDYAIIKDGAPIILIECKHHKEKLDPHSSQLFRYFHTTKAKFGLLTNGIVYRFYTDLVEPNKMDEKPFFEFDVTEIRDAEIEELKKFHKSYFDLENIVTTASELKYSNEIKVILTNELKSPSVEFVKFFATKVYNGQVREKVIIQFTDIVKKSANQLISDMINDRLKSALEKENLTVQQQQEAPTEEKTADEKRGVVTTEEEKEAFHVVKAILRHNLPIERIAARDTKSYFGILLDDNNRKPLCRLYLNGSKKYIGVFGANREETKHEISKVDDIFNYSEQIVAAIDIYSQELGKAENEVQQEG